jgi:elongation factor 2
MYLCDIVCPNTNIAGVYQTLTARRGRIVPDAEDQMAGGISKIRAYLPVLESFGFTQLLRQNTCVPQTASSPLRDWNSL